MSGLKPCPFCGGEAAIRKVWNAHSAPCQIEVDHSEECPAAGTWFPTESEAIAAWNTRAEANPGADALVGEACRRCGADNPPWFAPSPLWNAVMRGGSIDGDWEFAEIICAACFMILAEQRGIASGWRVTAEKVNVPLETVTPSGRVWSDEENLWVAPGNESVGPGAHRVLQEEGAMVSGPAARPTEAEKAPVAALSAIDEGRGG